VKAINNNAGLQTLYTFAAIVIIFAGIKAASQIIVPFLLALFLSVVLYPIIRFASKHRVRPAISISLIMLVIVIGFFVVSNILASSLNDFARSLPASQAIILDKIRVLQEHAALLNVNFSTEELMAYFDPVVLMNFISRMLSSFSGMMTGIFLLMMTIFFMLLEVSFLPGKLNRIMKNPDEGMASIQSAIKGITRYVAIKTVISGVTGLIVWIFLSGLGVKFALLWAMMAFLLNYIPNIGSIIAALPPILQSLVFNGFYDALIVSGGFILINIVLGNIIEPRVMGRGLGLSTLVVFLSLIFWGWLLGPIGMILSVPLTIVIKIALENSSYGKNVAILLGDGK
jgi:AI-2 transport protein TqsA